MVAVTSVLEEREAYLKTMIDSIDDVILEIDINGNIESISTSDEVIMGFVMPKGENQNANIDSILFKDEAEQALKVIREVMRTGEPNSVEYRVDAPSGMKWYQARVALMREGEDTVVASARDITDRKEMEQNLIDARG